MSSNKQEVVNQLVMDASDPDLEVKINIRKVAVVEEDIEFTAGNELPPSQQEIKDETIPATTNIVTDTVNQNESQVESLQQITTAQEQLSTVKKDLLNIIDAVSQNQSLVTQASNYWGTLSLVQRIAGGVIIAGPTLAAGIALNIGALITISGYTGIAYVAGGFIFEDHHKCNTNAIERLKTGVGSLADILEITIAALEKIRIKFAQEIEKFKNENINLINHIKELGNEIVSLGNEVLSLTITSKHLLTVKEELEETNKIIKENAEEQQTLAEKRQQELTQVKCDCERSHQLLTEKVKELDTVKQSFQTEVEKAKLLGEVLKGTVNTMADVVLKNGDQQDLFRAKMDAFLSDKETSFHLVADRICDAETELKNVKNELQQSNDRYKELLVYHRSLLEQQEAQVTRLEQLQSVNVKNKDQLQPMLNDGLLNFGVFSNKTNVPPARDPVTNPQQNQENSITVC